MGRRGRNKWQMLDPGQEPSFGPWIKCQKLEDKITMPQTSWRKYILWPHVNSSSHNSFPYNGIILCRKEIMDDQGKPLSGSTMWQKPGNLPEYAQYWAELIPSSLPSQPTALGFIFHPKQCFRPKGSLSTVPRLSSIRETAVVRPSKLNQIPTLSWVAQEKSFLYTQLPSLFSKMGESRSTFPARCDDLMA